MTASPPLNGHQRPAMPVLGDWRPATPEPEPVKEQRDPQPEPAVETAKSDTIAQAEAEAIRARAWAESEERRIKAEAEAKAIELKAAAEAEKQRLANERQRMQLEQKSAEHEARIAEANRKREEAERATENARRQAEEEQEQAAAAAEEIAAADDKWRSYALWFYRVCAVVALPVQLNAFYDRDALWLMAAPLMLEGGAWVVQKGAASAVANGRPSWHYRLIAWLLAFIAAGINLWHGLNAFDPATALGTAFASIAGPGVWDLHEHGRIRRRDGALTRRERRARDKAAKAEAAQRTAEEKRRAAEKAAAEKAAEDARTELTERRMRLFPKVWEHAEKLAADLGETDPNAVWARAKLDVEGAKPGESAEVFRMRNAAEARVDAAREKRSVNGSSPQVASQVLGPKKPRVYNPPARPGRRTKGDVKYSPVASRQASIAARDAAAKKTVEKDPS
ncbi:hypothetical protein ADK57_25925 [Streptomyces sp. MMG1533]|uniref:hypothetical protein n=1 Tax=Streptomyces sp. MMG1533 TaxID=1415546 RepID=UPI0006AE5EA5|nr:hypothetical protein [Streptomyces sp. MMG1533]KOU62073.1 hypothetical protein ADK57_25925 [Streptomyces sp. MMG1533]